MQSYIIVKASLNTAFPDKPTFEGVMSEQEAHTRCKQLNKNLGPDANFSYKPRQA